MSTIDLAFNDMRQNLLEEFDRKGGKEIRLGKAKSLSLFNELTDLDSLFQTNRTSALVKIDAHNKAVSSVLQNYRHSVVILKARVANLRYSLFVEKSKSDANSSLISSLESQIVELQDIVTQFQSQESVISESHDLSLQAELEQFREGFYQFQQITDELRVQITLNDIRILELESLVSRLRFELNESHIKYSQLDERYFYGG